MCNLFSWADSRSYLTILKEQKTHHNNEVISENLLAYIPDNPAGIRAKMNTPALEDSANVACDTPVSTVTCCTYERVRIGRDINAQH